MKYASEKDVVGWLKKLKTGSLGGGGTGSGDMLKSVYDQNNNGIVDNAEKLGGKTESQLNVDMVDGHHALDFVLNYGDFRSAQIRNIDQDGLPSNPQLGDIVITKDTHIIYWYDGNAWEQIIIGSSGSQGYMLSLTAGNLATISTPANYFFGNKTTAPSTAEGYSRVYIIKPGIIKAASIESYFGDIGSGGNISVYLRKNATTDYLIQAITLGANQGIWQNSSLSISVAAGDFFEIKAAFGTFTTNPSNAKFSGSIYIE